MRQAQFGTYRRRLNGSVFILCLFCIVACSPSVAPGSNNSHTPVVAPTALLPGQQMWKQGVSSLLFGTNDTQEWANTNVETSTGIQQALKNAHLTLMRTFFFDKSLADHHPTTDAEIEQRLVTIEHSGMTCLGVLENIFDVEFDKHVVTYAGNRCQLYEFGNEPSFGGIPGEAYLNQWNTVIPLLRRINPHAKFIGPVDAVNDFLKAFLTGVKASAVLPDAVSFHWYACWQNTRGDCLNRASNVFGEVQQVRGWVRSTLGKDLPIGVTEWNYDPNNPPPAYGDDPKFITQFSSDALHAMIQAGVAFACQFDAASYSGYGRLDMFDVNTNQPKPQYYAIASLIKQYRP
jgi:hypothetical protein